MELQGYLSILRARRRVVIAVTAVSILFALLYSLTATPKYVAKASVFVSTSTGQTSGELAQSFPYAQGLVRSYAQVATEPVVLASVIRDLNLNTTPSRLARAITAQAPLDTVIIDISVTDTSAKKAAAIANAVATQLSTTANNLVPGATESTLPISITTLATADVPSFASSPRKSLNLTVALLLGLLLGTVLALSRDALDVRVRDARDATALAKVPVIGLVIEPKRTLRRLRFPSLQRRAVGTPRHLNQQLRTNFQSVRSQQSLRAVVFASARVDNATGQTVSNLATALGETGQKILVVDADVRRPTLAQSYGLSNDIGLTSVLIGAEPISTAIQRSTTSPVWVLPAGPELHDPSVMMDDVALQRLISELARLYEVVLIKAPPVLNVADGLMLGRISDGVIVVADDEAMNRDTLAEELRAFDIAGAAVVGVVLTRRS